MRPRRLPAVLVGLLLLLGGAAVPFPGEPVRPVESAAPPSPPFGLPFLDPPGPSTWFLSQAFGNTVNAYAVRHTLYEAGQGLHFGVDFAAPCGTPIVAIGDGVVAKIDAPEHKAPPHSLMIDHPNGYASFYGHLLQRPRLKAGQAVRQGDVVAFSGDSYGTCYSAPHLHLEIRDLTYRIAYNPVLLIAADWDNLALIARGSAVFARDLDNTRRWQYLDDQPELVMGGPPLNDYAHVWPSDWR